MLDKWKSKSIFGKISDIVFILFLGAMLTQQGRVTIGGWVNRISAQFRNPSKFEGKALTSDEYNWTLKGTDGQQINLNDYKGKVIFINSWATWCPPCVGEMPEIEELFNRFSDNPDIAFFMISNESVQKIKQFKEKNQYTFPVFSSLSNTPQPFVSSSIPTTYLISKSGKIIIQETGAMNWGGSKMEGIVKGLLNE